MPARSSQAYVESFAALLVAGCVSQGSSVRAYGYSQNVPSGILSTLGNYNTVSGDGEGSRHLQPLLEIRIIRIRQPAHGQVRVTTGTRAAHAVPESPLAYCNGRQFASRIVQFRSTPGYRGEDSLSYEVSFVDGSHDVYEKALSVR